ncbi:hypothetical protein [Bdellovibrio sp. HCB337]|uniref:hypothetical protein n=1 Tax=Bdellovibrio sp. HCB337 TaxID=3394358 RepID=UPI0039A67C9A
MKFPKLFSALSVLVFSLNTLVAEAKTFSTGGGPKESYTRTYTVEKLNKDQTLFKGSEDNVVVGKGIMGIEILLVKNRRDSKDVTFCNHAYGCGTVNPEFCKQHTEIIKETSMTKEEIHKCEKYNKKLVEMLDGKHSGFYGTTYREMENLRKFAQDYQQTKDYKNSLIEPEMDYNYRDENINFNHFGGERVQFAYYANMLSSFCALLPDYNRILSVNEAPSTGSTTSKKPAQPERGKK